MIKKHKKYIFIVLSIFPIYCAVYAVSFNLSTMEPFDIAWVKIQQYNERNMHEKMRVAYEKLVERHPENTELLYALGWAYYKTGAPEKGYQCMTHYMEANPFYPEWQRKYINIVRKAANNHV